MVIWINIHNDREGDAREAGRGGRRYGVCMMVHDRARIAVT
jgi:hypothetical protein